MDPTALQKIPRSEYRKRRQYYFEWRKANGGVQETEHGVTIEEDEWVPPPGAHVVE